MSLGGCEPCSSDAGLVSPLGATELSRHPTVCVDSTIHRVYAEQCCSCVDTSCGIVGTSHLSKRCCQYERCVASDGTGRYARQYGQGDTRYVYAPLPRQGAGGCTAEHLGRRHGCCQQTSCAKRATATNSTDRCGTLPIGQPHIIVVLWYSAAARAVATVSRYRFAVA